MKDDPTSAKIAWTLTQPLGILSGIRQVIIKSCTPKWVLKPAERWALVPSEESSFCASLERVRRMLLRGMSAFSPVQPEWTEHHKLGSNTSGDPFVQKTSSFLPGHQKPISSRPKLVLLKLGWVWLRSPGSTLRLQPWSRLGLLLCFLLYLNPGPGAPTHRLGVCGPVP